MYYQIRLSVKFNYKLFWQEKYLPDRLSCSAATTETMGDAGHCLYRHLWPSTTGSNQRLMLIGRIHRNRAGGGEENKTINHGSSGGDCGGSSNSDINSDDNCNDNGNGGSNGGGGGNDDDNDDNDNDDDDNDVLL
jgi:hypothetical protein